jgi:aminoglycoside phosphotransferase (APT) family kinase protein
VSLRVPEPVTTGRPTDAYPFTWAIYRWIEGRPYQDVLIEDERQVAADLAQFVTELRSLDPAGAPRGGRRPLRELDSLTRTAIDASRDVIDAEAATAAWARALRAPEWAGEPVWIHTDLLRPNLLVDDGRLHAVIDFGGAGVGDPAADVIAAWSVFNAEGRETYRAALHIDYSTWERARGYALHQTAMIIPYYASTNPLFVALAKRTIVNLLADMG